jgi:hypothetical protein
MKVFHFHRNSWIHSFSWLSFSTLVLFSCGREFDPPPPEVRIEGIDPAEGFMGDAVKIAGENFDPVLENNLVFFGTAPADTTALETTADQKQALTVIVPELSVGKDVSIVISTGKSQGSSVGLFHYIGPGHPREETLAPDVHLNAGPIAVVALPNIPLPLTHSSSAPTAVVLNQKSRSLSLLDLISGLHFDIGVGNFPLSLAAIRTAGASLATAYVITLNVNENFISTNLRKIAISNPGNDQETGLNYSAGEDSANTLVDVSIQPNRIWSFCLDDPLASSCRSYLLIASDLFQPILSISHIISYANGTEEVQTQAVSFKETSKTCPQFPERIKDISLLRGWPSMQLLVSFSSTPEIFECTLDENLSLETKSFWAPNPPDCLSTTVTAMSFQSDNNVLYLGTVDSISSNSSLVILPPSGETKTLAVRNPIRAIVSAIQKGTPPSEFLYFLSNDGLWMGHSPSNPSVSSFPENLILPASNAMTESPSLFVYKTPDGNSDSVFFADYERDEIVQLEAGQDPSLAVKAPLGSSLPSVAPSGVSYSIYQTDRFSNVIRMINENSGMQDIQIPIRDFNTKGAADTACMSLGGVDLVFVPLLDFGTNDSATRSKYNRMIVRKIENLSHINAIEKSWNDSLSKGMPPDPGTLGLTDAFEVPLGDDESFSEIAPSLSKKALFFVQYGEGIKKGRIWSWSVNPSNEQGGVIEKSSRAGDSDSFFYEPARDFLLARFDPRNQVIGLYRTDLLLRAHVEVIRISDKRTLEEFVFPNPDALLINDMAIVDPREQPLVYVSVPLYKMILVAFQTGTASIPVAYFPNRFFPSPDGRRLYITHLDNGTISIIDTDCHFSQDAVPDGNSSPTCNQVTRTVQVGDLPDKVVFRAEGHKAFVTHLKGTKISVIE